MPTNAVTANIGSAYTVTTNDNGSVLFLGDASSSRAAVKTIQFVPNAGFQGTGFTVCARVYGPQPDKNAVPFNPIPYRRVQLAGLASDRAIVSDTLPATGFIIEVPCNGLVVALVTSATAGTGTLYQWNSVGSPT